MNSTRFLEIADEVRTKTLVREILAHLRDLTTAVGPDKNLGKEAFQILLFRAREAYHVLSLDKEVAEVMDSIGFAQAFDHELVARMIHSFHKFGSRNTLRSDLPSASDLFFLYYRLESLNRFIDGIRKHIFDSRKRGVQPGESTLAFEVMDLNQPGFSFDRLEEILPEIRLLYVELCTIFDVSEKGLRILYLDSGSGLTINIKGDAKIVDSMRRLFISVWDKIRFRKTEDFTRSLEALDSSLDILEKINEKKSRGVINDEDARRMSHLVSAHTLSLFEKGATLREIQKNETISNQALLLNNVQVKYLTSGEENKANQ